MSSIRSPPRCLRDRDPLDRQRTVGAPSQLVFEHCEELLHALLERVEPSTRVLLGRPVELALSDANLVLGVVSHQGHSPARLPAQASMSQGPFRTVLCCRAPSSGSMALPGWPATSRGSPLIPRRAPPDRNGRVGEGFSSSCIHVLTVPLPIPREVPGRCTPGSSRRPSAFAVPHAARLLLEPFRAAITRRKDSLEVTDRISCSPQRGSRHWAPTPDVSPRRRQSATRGFDTYRDRTHTGWRTQLARKSPHAAITSQAIGAHALDTL